MPVGGVIWKGLASRAESQGGKGKGPPREEADERSGPAQEVGWEVGSRYHSCCFTAELINSSQDDPASRISSRSPSFPTLPRASRPRGGGRNDGDSLSLQKLTLVDTADSCL